jgi:hypothetical protein
MGGLCRMAITAPWMLIRRIMVSSGLSDAGCGGRAFWARPGRLLGLQHSAMFSPWSFHRRLLLCRLPAGARTAATMRVRPVILSIVAFSFAFNSSVGYPPCCSFALTSAMAALFLLHGSAVLFQSDAGAAPSATSGSSVRASRMYLGNRAMVSPRKYAD